MSGEVAWQINWVETTNGSDMFQSDPISAFFFFLGHFNIIDTNTTLYIYIYIYINITLIYVSF